MKPINTTTLSNKIKSLLEDTMPGVAAASTDNEDTKSEENPEDCEDDPDECDEDQLTDPANQSDEPVVIKKPADDEEAEEDDVEESTSPEGKSADAVLGILGNYKGTMANKLSKLIAYSLQLSPVEQKKLLRGVKEHL